MLIFYYGLLFLGTLSITDGVATFLVLCLVDFLILKTIWQDNKLFVTWRKKKYEQLITLKTWGSGLLLEQWEEASLLKKTYIIVAGVIGFALLILFFVLYSQIFLIPFGFSTIKEIGANFALAFLGTVTGGVALFSGFLAILRSEEDNRQNEIAKSQADTAIEQTKIANNQSEIANKQANTAEQGLITDRINKATEGLGKSDTEGNPVIMVRLGALYALERIAKDSEPDHIQIMEILCAYIRNNSAWNMIDAIKYPSNDIEVAASIIARRHRWPNGIERIEKEKSIIYVIELNNCNLHGMSLSVSNMRDARLIGTNFSEGHLNYADMTDAWIGSSNLTGTKLKNTIMKNTRTNLAYARTGDFSECINLTQDQVDLMFLGKGVKLADGLNHPQEGTDYYKYYATFDEFFTAYNEWVETQP